MENRIAILDLGTNTCRLVVFAYNPAVSYKLVDQISERVRIGEGMFTDNRLKPEPMERAVKLLRMYRELCAANGIDHIIATASSAVRDAYNRDEFLNRVETESGLRLRVLSEQEEAYYAYLGAVNSIGIENGIVADLGGGSLELVQVRNRLPAASASLPLGAVRLTERFSSNDRLSKGEFRELKEFVDGQIDQVAWFRPDSRTRLVVLGGAARALAKLDQRLRCYPFPRLHGYILSRDAVRNWAKQLLTRPLEDRLKIRGFKAERADVLPAGALVIARLVKHLDVDSATVSGQGLREGLFYEEFLKDCKPKRSRLPKSREFSAGSQVPLIPDLRAFGVSNLSALHQVDLTHSNRVCHLALELFDQLRKLHRFGLKERSLLVAAAQLHDIGVTIDYYRHHLHSAYLIENADLPGFSQREMALIALMVRWHRQGTPDVQPFGEMLDEKDGELVGKLSAILRLAEDLERSRAQIVRDLTCRVTRNVIEVHAATTGPAEAELWSANRNSALFRATYGRKLVVSASIADQQ